MTAGRTAVRGSAITLAGQWLRFGIQTASLVLLAHLISPHDFGIVAMVTAIIGIATVIGDFGLSLAAVQARQLGRAEKSNLFWMNLLVGATLNVIVLALAGPIASFYHRPGLAHIVRFLSIAFLINGLTTQFEAELTRGLKFRKLAAKDVGSQGMAFVVAVVLALLHTGYWALVGQQLAVAVGSLVACAALSGWWPSLPDLVVPMRKLVTFGTNTMFVQVFSYVSSNVDNVLVGRFWGANQLGVYSRAYQIFSLPVQQLAAPLTRVVLPILSRIDDDVVFLRYVARAQLVLSYGLISVLAVGAAVAQPLIAFALGSRWENAAPIFQVLAVGGAFQALSYVYYWVFLARAATGIQLRYSVIGRSCMMIFIFVGVHFSPLGAAVGAAAGLIVLWLLYTTRGMSRTGFNGTNLNRDTARVLATFAFVVLAAQSAIRTHVLPASPGPQLACALAISALAFTMVYLCFPVIRKDVADIKSTAQLLRGQRAEAPAPPAPPENEPAEESPVAMS